MKVDPNDKIWQNASKTNAVNSAYLAIQSDGNFNWDENVTTGTFNTVSGVQEYAYTTYLPNFVRADLVQFTSDAGNISPANKKYALMNVNTGNAKPSNYYFFSRKIGFYPVPDGAYSVTVLYRQKLPDMSSTVDCAFDSAFDDAIAKYAAYNIWSTTKVYDKANKALQDYNKALNFLKMTYLFNDSASLSFPFQKGGVSNFSSNKLY